MLEGTASERRPNSRLSCQLVVTPDMDGLVVLSAGDQTCRGPCCRRMGESSEPIPPRLPRPDNGLRRRRRDHPSYETTGLNT